MTRQIATYNPVIPGLVPDAEVAELARSFHVIEDAGEMLIDHFPTAAEREKLGARVMSLARLLQPYPDFDNGKALAQKELADMLMGFGTVRADRNQLQVVATYLHHLRDVPLFALQRACDDIRRGAVYDVDPRTGNHIPLDPDYPPSTVRVRRVADKYISTAFAEKYEMEKILRTRKLLPKPMTDDERRRAGIKAAEIVAGLREAQAEYDLAEARRHAENYAKARERDAAAIRAEYEKTGIEPKGVVGLGMISLELAERLGLVTR